jgi:hypothetical protein
VFGWVGDFEIRKDVSEPQQPQPPPPKSKTSLKVSANEFVPNLIWFDSALSDFF